MSTKSIKFLILSCIFLLSINSIGLCQVYEAWVARYNGPGNHFDLATALAVDASGNVYVTGRSVGSGTFYDYATIKYSPNGDTLWVRRYSGQGNSDDYNALAVDNNGNVYVTGSSGGAYATIKYAPNGDEIWVSRYNAGYASEQAHALAVDNNGNVYVTGSSASSSSYPYNFDYATIKYSSAGDTLWVRRYNGPGNSDDGATALAVDDSGNVSVTGYSYGSGSNYDYATIKYAPNGDTLWVRRYNGPANLQDIAYDLAVDNEGNVYVAGKSDGGGSGLDYTTIKYAPNGDSLWVRRYNGPGNGGDAAFALALDASSNVYVTGGSSGDYATVKYAPNGDTQWVKRFNGLANDNDYAIALAVDSIGNAYVTGYSYSGPGPADDYVTIKYASNGDTLWVRRYNGPDNGGDFVSALALDESGNVYVTGWTAWYETYYDYATVKYAPCTAKAGDADSSGTTGFVDVIRVVNYIFLKSGCSSVPNCWLSNPFCRGDWNGDTFVNLSDVIHGINFIFGKPGNWAPVPSGTCCLPAP